MTGGDRREAIPPGPQSRQTVKARRWSAQGDCLAWELCDRPGLTVTEEEMPAERSETPHRHDQARQVFYVLEGVVEIDLDGTHRTLYPGDAQEVPPLCPHKVANAGPDPARFLIISSPRATADRTDL